MPIARFWNRRRAIWLPRNRNWRRASRKPPPRPQALAELEHQQEQSRVAIVEAVAAASTLRNQLTQAKSAWPESIAKPSACKLKWPPPTLRWKPSEDSAASWGWNLKPCRSASPALTEELRQTRQPLESKRREESEAKNHLDSLRAEYASAIGKKGSLEAVIAEHGYSTESVRRLFQSGVMQGGLAPAGVLADFLEVETRYEGVVEDFLRDELNYIVVKSWDAADEGLRLLRTDVDGRATFLVHPEDSQAKFSFAVDENAHQVQPERPIVPLKNAIRVLNGFGRSLEVILPKLRDGYIVPDPAFARELALENPDAFFLSQSGECFHNVTVTGGKQRAEGPLSMKRELRDVLRLLGELERALRDEEMRVLTLGREIKDLTSLLDRLEGEKREAEKQAMTSGHMLQQLESEMTRVGERLQTSRQELQRLEAERAEQGSAARSAAACEIAAARSNSASSWSICAAAAQEQLSRPARAPRSGGAERLAAIWPGWPRSKSGIAAPPPVLERIESLVAEMSERVAALRLQIESAAAEKLQRETENQELAVRLVDFEAERNACETRDGLLQFESEQVRARLAEIDEALQQARQLLDQARDRRAELSAAAAKLQSDAQYMAETCLNELGVQRDELMATSRSPSSAASSSPSKTRSTATCAPGWTPWARST